MSEMVMAKHIDERILGSEGEPTPGTVVAEQMASTLLASLTWIREQGWMHGELIELTQALAYAYEQGYGHAVEYASESCPNEDCECTCH